jgi:predicted transcriptional regulator of viral defense system
MKERILEIVQQSGFSGVHLEKLYAEFPESPTNSVRGSVLRLEKEGKLERVSAGTYKTP